MSPRRPHIAAAALTVLAAVLLTPGTAAHAGLLPTCDSGAFAGGDGSVGSPYQVNGRSPLNEVRDCLDKNFIQTADISLGGAEWTPIGSNEGYGPKHFTGTYDGGDHNITGLSITIDSTYGIGLFGASFGTLKNVHVAGSITLTGNSINVGGLVGSNFNTIQHSSSAVTVSAPGSDWVGGLNGFTSPGSISDSSASGSVTGRNQVGGLIGVGGGALIGSSFATGAVTGANNVGGLAGSVGDSHLVTNSYARGAVAATGTGGGLIGSMFLAGVVSNSYATGAVTAAAGGGLIGFLDVQASYTVSNDVWDTETTGRSTDASTVGTIGRVTADMHLLTTFTGYSWDIDTSGSKVWQICNGVNDNYPFLTSEGRTVPSCIEPVPTLPPTGTSLTPLWIALGLLGGGAALFVADRRRRLAM